MATDLTIKIEELLVPGRVYKLRFSDCCVEGEIKGKLARLEPGENRQLRLVFDGQIDIDLYYSMIEDLKELAGYESEST